MRSDMYRLGGAICAAIVAVSFARALDVPVWRNWPIGDQFDIAVCTFLAAILLTQRKFDHDPR